MCVHMYLALTRYEVDRGMAWEQAVELFNATKASGADAYFLTSRRAPYGYARDHPFRPVGLITGRISGMNKSGRSQLFKLVLPASGMQRGNRLRSEIRDRWLLTKFPEKVESAWKKQHAQAAKKCGHPPGYFKHGNKCSKADETGYCSYELRKIKRHIVAGATLQV